MSAQLVFDYLTSFGFDDGVVSGEPHELYDEHPRLVALKQLVDQGSYLKKKTNKLGVNNKDGYVFFKLFPFFLGRFIITSYCSSGDRKCIKCLPMGTKTAKKA